MPTVAQRYEQMMEMREHPAPSFIEEGVCVCVWPNRAERRRQFKMLLRSVKRAMRRG